MPDKMSSSVEDKDIKDKSKIIDVGTCTCFCLVGGGRGGDYTVNNLNMETLSNVSWSSMNI